MPRRPSELSVVLLIAAVQFVNVLDFVMVMPLGPDFSKGLGIPTSHLGYIGGSYTAAAAVSGLLSSLFLDKFDRRTALGWAMFGLVLGTAAGGFATDLPTLILARAVAGSFGGPATSLSFSIIADLIPARRRGKAMGIVMGAFSFAAVVGIPAGLELAERGGWRLPFFGVALLGVVVAMGAVFWLPPLTGHLAVAATRAQATTRDLARRPLVLLSWTLTALVMMAGFILIPNISAYMQGNVGVPRGRIGQLYMAGGVVSFFATQIGGRLVDAFGSFRTALGGTLVLVITVESGFVLFPPLVAPVVLFMLFMLALGLRNVAYNTLCSRVPEAHERARFMSIQSAVQHFASAGGAFLSARLLTERADHALLGMDVVGRISIGLSVVAPGVVWLVERGVHTRDRGRGAATVVPVPIGIEQG